MPPCAAPASTTSLPELVEEVSVAAAPCKPRGPIKRKTGEKPRSHAGDDTSSCPEAPKPAPEDVGVLPPSSAPPKSVSEEGGAVPPCAAPASTTSLPELVEEVSVAAAPCKPRGPIKRKTGEKPRSHAGDDTSSCPEAPKPAPEDVGVLPPSPAQTVSPSRKRPLVVPCAASPDDVLDSPPAKKGTQEAQHLQPARPP